MPVKNVIKPYVENGYYHLYNRGAHKQPLFLRKNDYYFFISLLIKYLSPEYSMNPLTGLVDPMNLSNELDLLCFCLMPNHFHFLVKQKTKYAITALTRRLFSSYAGYFNKKHGHGGGLFESKLKGVLIDTDMYLVYLSKYIHRNPKDLPKYAHKLINYPYSSYQYFFSTPPPWIKPNDIVAFFHLSQSTPSSGFTSYQRFVEEDHEEYLIAINNFLLDELAEQPK